MSAQPDVPEAALNLLTVCHRHKADMPPDVQLAMDDLGRAFVACWRENMARRRAERLR